MFSRFKEGTQSRNTLQDGATTAPQIHVK